MTFTIPEWVFVAFGCVAGLFVLAMAAIGVIALMLADKLPGGRFFDK